jgi:hypothetical protein
LVINVLEEHVASIFSPKDTIRSSEKLVNTYKTTWHCNEKTVEDTLHDLHSYKISPD